MIATSSRRFCYDGSLLVPQKWYRLNNLSVIYIGKSRSGLYKFLLKTGTTRYMYRFTPAELYEHIFIYPPINPQEGWFETEPHNHKYVVINLKVNHRTAMRFAYHKVPTRSRVIADLKRLTWVGREQNALNYHLHCGDRLELEYLPTKERQWALEPITEVEL